MDCRAESSASVRQRVIAARQRQQARQGKPNAQLHNSELQDGCRLDSAGQTLLDTAIERLGLSARAYHRILRLARTIADLAGADQPCTAHLAEAISYRRLDRRPDTIPTMSSA